MTDNAPSPRERANVLVRPARSADAPAVADVQLVTYRTSYAPMLPPGALDALNEVDVEARWREAVERPPTSRHVLLVAEEDGRLVGYAALGPAEDEPPETTVGELYALDVHPDQQGQGHGSRLLNAAVDVLRAAGFQQAVMWLFEADGASQAFLQDAGWGFDDVIRQLDMGAPVEQVRMRTLL